MSFSVPREDLKLTWFFFPLALLKVQQMHKFIININIDINITNTNNMNRSFLTSKQIPASKSYTKVLIILQSTIEFKPVVNWLNVSRVFLMACSMLLKVPVALVNFYLIYLYPLLGPELILTTIWSINVLLLW